VNNKKLITFALLAATCGSVEGRYESGKTPLDGFQLIASADTQDGRLLEFANINREDESDSPMHLALLLDGVQLDAIATLEKSGWVFRADLLKENGDNPTSVADFDAWLDAFRALSGDDETVTWVFDERDNELVNPSTAGLTNEQQRKLKLADDILRYARVLWVALPDGTDYQFTDLLKAHGFDYRNVLSDDYNADSRMEAHT
jgi:hypothetical protein